MAEVDVTQDDAFESLQAAVKLGGDIMLTAGEKGEASLAMEGTLEVPDIVTVHLFVQEGDTVTLQRTDDSKSSSALFAVASGGTLILGDGALTWTGTDAKAAYQAGSYNTVSKGGGLVIDGGAEWEESSAFTTSSFFYNNTIVFYDPDDGQYVYTNSGIEATASLIESEGTLSLWGGVTLQNNDKQANFGSAVYSKSGSELNMYGGTVTRCATKGSSDMGQGAVYLGDSSVSWTTKPDTLQASFRMWGGSITNNTCYGGSSSSTAVMDGGGIALDQADMALYGGEISYNHAGLQNSYGGAGDGGGIMVRCGSVLDMYGGQVSHNYAGGYGGGIVAWNADINIHGGEITENTGGYGGGIGIAASYGYDNASTATSSVKMTGGLVAYNEAMKTAALGGYGGGICAGSGNHKKGAHLDLSGGTIQQNKALNGGGIAVYAEGNGTAEADTANTEVTLAGDFEMKDNTAYQQGGGMYITNQSATNRHALLTMSGAARIDTNNTVYFENVTEDQVPVQVNGNLTTSGTAALFEFSDEFWNGTSSGYDKAAAGRSIIHFGDGLDIQENKFALDSTEWYLDENSETSALELQKYSETKQYWIRNGTAVRIDGKNYYRIYDDLDTAFDEAASGDILYLFYNATMMEPAVVEGSKTLTLLAESTSSAGVAASTSGGACEFDTSRYGDYGYYVMSGSFLVHVGAGGTYDGSGNTGSEYAISEYSYNVRNDYTITLSSQMKLNVEDADVVDSGAIVVTAGSTLNFGQEIQSGDGMGYGKLTFDGNASYPLNGAMLAVQEGGAATLYSGITLTNHTNFVSSETNSTPEYGTVYNAGSFTMKDGSAITNGVSSQAGAVYNGESGTFFMEGGSITNSEGAMPRSAKTNDHLYWGQAKYYLGAGAVYNAGVFEMSGGSISGNRGEYGAVADQGVRVALTGGSITGNAAVTGVGAGTVYSLTITGYDDGDIPKTTSGNPGSGGGVFLMGTDRGESADIGSVTVSNNWAEHNGGGIAVYGQANGPVSVENAVITDNTAGELGGGLYTEFSRSDTEDGLVLRGGVTLTGNSAKAGGGLAAVGAEDRISRVRTENSIQTNTADYGGGVYVGPYAYVTAAGSLEDNTALYGGGAYIDCLKTLEDEDVSAIVDPGSADQYVLDSNAGETVLENARAALGADVENSDGTLTLDGGRINNNKLSSDSGYGGGVYNRGSLVLGKGAYSSANDRLYMELGHVTTLLEDYQAAGQSSVNPLSFNSRSTQLGTDIVKAAAQDQALALLQDGLVTHYTGIPMAPKGQNPKVIELNYVTVTYYDRLPGSDADGMGSHAFSVAVTPNTDYTIISWSAVNNQISDVSQKLAAPDGKSLSKWMVCTRESGTLQATDASYNAGNNVVLASDLYLVAEYTSNSYTAFVSSVVGSQTSDIGSVKLINDTLTSNTANTEYYFAKNAAIEIQVDPVTDASGHQAGILTGLTVYEQTDKAGVTPGEGEYTYGGYIYRAVAGAEFENISLTVADGNAETYSNTGIVKGWKELVNDASGTFSYNENTGRLCYTSGEKNIVIVAQFTQPMVELTMTDGGGETVLTEYYDTMRQAFTRMANKIAQSSSAAWGASTITPLQAHDTDGVVYYYGKDYTGSTTDNTFGGYSGKVGVIFDLNGLTMDFQNAPQQFMSQYSLTVKDGAIVGHVTEPLNRNTEQHSSLFAVKNDGTLTLQNAKITNAGSDFDIILDDSGKLSVDQSSRAGRVYLETDKAKLTVTGSWTEREDTDGYVADLYVDLNNLVDTNSAADSRKVIVLAEDVIANSGHAIRSRLNLSDSVTNDDSGDESGRWFIGTDGILYRRIQDVIPRLVCEKHPNGGDACIRTETEAGGQYDNGYPLYYVYERAYGYDSAAHPLIVTAELQDAYGKQVTSAGGTVMLTVSRARDGASQNRVLNASVAVTGGKAAYTETGASPSFAVDPNYYVGATYSGSGQYAAAYAGYWKVDDFQRADNDSSTISGISKLSITAKALNAPSVSLISVTPNTAGYVGPDGAASGATSQPGTIRTQDSCTGLNLTNGVDIQYYYRRVTTTGEGSVGEAGTVNGVTYYYADTYYYTASGAWYGGEAPEGNFGGSINGQDVGLYSLEMAAINGSANYTALSGWKGRLFEITPYTGQLNTEMTSSIVVPGVETDREAVIAAVEDVITGLKITDSYGNEVSYKNVTYSFSAADSNAQVDADGWPCREGLYSIVIHPYTGGTVNDVTQQLIGTPDTDSNYSSAAIGYQALLITKEKLKMEIRVNNDGSVTQTGGDDIALRVPYTGQIYSEADIKAYDSTYGAGHDNLLVRLVSASGNDARRDASAYNLTVGLPSEPAQDAGTYVMVATDHSGQYVAIGTVEVLKTAIARVTVDPDSVVYTGKAIYPAITVLDNEGNTLVEGRDYIVTIGYNGSIVGSVINAGQYTITVAGIGNYASSATADMTAKFTVQPKDISENADDNDIPVIFSVPSYNLDGSVSGIAVYYNGTVLGGSDYTLSDDGMGAYTFKGINNFKGERTVNVQAVNLPSDSPYSVSGNTTFTYQATDLFGYLNDSSLTITKQDAEGNTANYALSDFIIVEIGTVADYVKAPGTMEYRNASSYVLDAGAYIVQMKDSASETASFFVTIEPQLVELTVDAASKVYGTSDATAYSGTTFAYSTNLPLIHPDGAGDLGSRGFYQRDEDGITGQLSRGSGESVGDYYYALGTFSAGGNYTLTVSSATTFTITHKSLQDSDVTVACRDTVEYTGYPVSPIVSVTYAAGTGGKTLHANADYTAAYYKVLENGSTELLSGAPNDVGRYQVAVTGMGNYKDTVTKEFEVTAVSTGLQVTIADNTVTYKAAAYHPAVTVLTGSGDAINNTMYSLTYSYTTPAGQQVGEAQTFNSGVGLTEAGTYTIYANGLGNYVGAYGTATFTIERKQIGADDDANGTTPVNIEAIGDQLYSGAPLTPGITATYSGLENGGLTEDAVKTLEKDQDYYLTYQSNTNAGTATVTVYGTGNYTGSRQVTFRIEQQTVYVEIAGAEKVYGDSDPVYTYTVYRDEEGTAALTGVTVLGAAAREPGEDVGEYALHAGTLSAGSNYVVRLIGAPKLTIVQKPLGDNDQNPAERIGASIGSVEAVEDAGWPEPTVIYWAATATKDLVKGTDFTVTYQKADGTPVMDFPINEADYGQYFALVEAKSANYSQKIKLSFQIVKQGSYLALNATDGGSYDPAGKKITLTAKYSNENVSAAAGISYTVTCYSASGTTWPVPVTKDQAAGEAYFTATDAGTYVITATYSTSADITAYGSTTTVVRPKDIKDVDVGAIPEQDYSGDAVTPDLTIADGEWALQNGRDYSVSYANNVQPNSTATATITGFGNYTGTRQVSFQIGPMQYTLEYDANGGNGTGLPAAQHTQDRFSVASGTGMTHVAEDGVSVVFIAWTTENTNEKIYGIGDSLPGSASVYFGGQTLTPVGGAIVTTLYALWGYDADGDGTADVNQNAISVKYNAAAGDSGQPPEDLSQYLPGSVAKAMGKGSLTHSGYTFLGWTAMEGGKLVDTLADYAQVGTVYTENSSFIVGIVGGTGGNAFNLYPVWGVDRDGSQIADFLEGGVSLIYNANGGTGELSGGTYKAGADVELDDGEGLRRSGAVLIGWSESMWILQTERPGTGSYYALGGTYSMPQADEASYVVLYALWAADANNNGTPDYEETRYTVAYDANGGEGSVTDSNTYLSGQTVTLAGGAGLRKTGYTFAGWSLEKAGTPISYSYTMEPSDADTNQTVTFYAVWQESLHTIQVNAGTGGTASASAESVRDGGSATVDITPSDGYSLDKVWVNGTDMTDAVSDHKLTLEDIAVDMFVTVTFRSNDFAVAIAPEKVTYSGTEQAPETLKVTSSKVELYPESYTVAYEAVAGTGASLGEDNKPLTAGTYTVTVTGQGAYGGKTATATFVVEPKTLTKEMVSVRETTTGGTAALDVTVQDEISGTQTTLTEGKDYTVSYSGGVTANSEVTVTVTGIGNYQGTVTTDITISDDSLRTVTYKNGSASVDTQSYPVGATVTVRSALEPASDDVVFSGWQTADGTTIYQPGETFVITDDTTLTAVWTQKDTVTLTYKSGSAAENAPAAQTVFPGGSVTLAAALTREGYTFLGWIKADQEITIAAAEGITLPNRVYLAGEELVLSESMTLFPLWIVDTLCASYSLVLYRPNGGDDSGIQATAFLVANGQEYSIISQTPTRAGYTFAGWQLDGTTYGAGDSYTVPSDGAANSIITFTAQWTALDRYSVTYDKGGDDDVAGDAPTDSSAYLAGDTVTVLSAVGLSKEDHVFDGWSDGSKTYCPGETFVITDDTTLTAVWTPESRCTVTYHANNGQENDVLQTESCKPYTTMTLADGSDLAYNGYKFLGWSTEKTGVITDSADIPGFYVAQSSFTIGAQDVDLFAVWATAEVANTHYTLTFVNPDNTIQVKVPTAQSYTVGTEVDVTTSIVAGTPKGYTFRGWSKKESGAASVETVTMNSDRTLYAVFEETPYAITSYAGTGGSITPAGETTLKSGGSQTYTITVNSGYALSSVLVDLSEVTLTASGGLYTYTFSNVSEDHSIIVMFKRTSTGSGGSTATPQPTPSTPSTDQPEDPDRTGVSSWLRTDQHFAYLNGYANGTFRPDSNITRGEVAQMFYNLLRSRNVGTGGTFTDVPDGSWCADAVNTMSALGIMNGYSDGSFRPSAAITRAEFAAVATRFAKAGTMAVSPFTDVDQGYWAYDAIMTAASYGWISGYADGTFRPYNNIRRGEVTKIVNYMLGRVADGDYIDAHRGELKQFSDVPTSYWAYYIIVEASNSHGYSRDSSQLETWTGIER